MLREHKRQLYWAWMATDLAIGTSVFISLVFQPALQRDGFSEGGVALAALGAVVCLAWPLIFERLGVYASQRRESLGGLLGSLAAAHALGAMCLSAVAFTLDARVAPLFPFIYAATVFGLQGSMRVVVFSVLRAVRRSGGNFRNVLIIGAGPRAAEVRATIEEHPEWGLRIVGYVDDGGGEFVPRVPAEEIHKLMDLPTLLRDENIDEALVAIPRTMLPFITPVVRECALVGVPVTLLTDLFGDQLPPPRVGRFDSLATLSFAPVHHNDIELGIKRSLDIAGATAVLLLTAPLLLLSALAIKVSSPGPVLFRQVRSGLHGRRFNMLKLRTMCMNAESMKAELLHLNEMDGPVFKIKDDPRVTLVGRVLRRFSIDELPQLWNVLRGDMSLVGPRPPTPDEVCQYVGSDRRRLSMRPGITCLWQISGRNEVSFVEWMKLDLEYIDNWSLAEDVRILIRTIPEVLRARGAS
ncbi:MAG: sugar transferase [Proteobacteria bacterium]|nr:sugar transferase [Pseudomonadota bacterium]